MNNNFRNRRSAAVSNNELIKQLQMLLGDSASEKVIDTIEAVEGFLAKCRSGGLSQRTISWYRYMLAAFARANPQLPQKLDPIEDFLGQDISDELRHGRYRALNAFYNWAARRYQVTNPMLEIVKAPKKEKKIPRSLTLVEIGYLLLTPLSKRDRIIVNTLIDTGIRVGELVGLDAEDIEDDKIYVSGKTGQRQVPISPETRRQLLDLAEAGPIFRGNKGRRLTTSGVYQALRAALIRAGISGKKLGPHTFRHTFGRQYLMQGGDLVSLQRILGHANISTTRIYAELDTADVQRQHHAHTPLKWAKTAVQGQLFDPAAPAPEPVGVRRKKWAIR